MIQISDHAQQHFRRLLETQGGDAVGIRLGASDPGTPSAEVRLEFCDAGDLDGRELAIACEGFTLYLDAASAPFFAEAEVDYQVTPTGGELNIRAPGLKGERMGADAALEDRVRYTLDSVVNPQLASHGGRVKLEGITSDGIVLLRFGGGCHGCGMVDVTLKQGVEKTLLTKVPGVTGVRDVTDHGSGETPYYAPR